MEYQKQFCREAGKGLAYSFYREVTANGRIDVFRRLQCSLRCRRFVACTLKWRLLVFQAYVNRGMCNCSYVLWPQYQGQPRIRYHSLVMQALRDASQCKSVIDCISKTLWKSDGKRVTCYGFWNSLLDFGAFGLWDCWTFVLWDFGTLGLLDFWTSGVLDFWTLGLWDFGTSGLLDFLTFGLWDFWTF